MSQTIRKTWQSHRVGQVLFTMQIDPHDGEFHIDRHRGLSELTRRMVNVFSAYQMRATWAAGSPAKCSATAAVMTSATEHELAILGNASWLGPNVGRMRFAQELGRRVHQAATAGVTVNSLVPQVSSIKEHADLLIKLGISSVAGLPRTVGAVPSGTPRALHFGLWELPVTQNLPQPATWWSSTARSILRGIRTAAAEGSSYHLVVDLATVEREGAKCESIVAKIIRGVAELRNRGTVRVETLSSAAAKLGNVTVAAPQRSILRQAA
jgi:hypothetical protein